MSFTDTQLCTPAPATKVTTTATTPSKTTVSSVCPKCGTIKKSDKRSCCARGGAWFNNCGDDGDGDSDHTWFEGIQACKTPSSSISGEAQAQAMKTTSAQHLHDTKQSTIGPVTADDVRATSSKDYGELTNIIVFTGLLLYVLYGGN